MNEAFHLSLMSDSMGHENLSTQAEGIKIQDFHLVTRQIGDDGIYRKVETGNYFVKSPATEDILVISLCHNISE